MTEPMKSLRLAVLLLVVSLVAACAGGDGGLRPYSVSSHRGELESTRLARTLAREEIDAATVKNGLLDLVGNAQCGIKSLELVYRTIGVHGEAADASAVLLVPDGCPGPYPVLAYGNGTRTLKGLDSAATDAGALTAYAANGYVVVASDYLGLGKSGYPYHPYLHADSEASAMIDAIRAARHAGESLGVRYSGKVMVAGYSQGGHTALATQRAIERDHLDEFDLVATVPMSGPYALSQTFIEGWQGQTSAGPNPMVSELFAYTIVSYQRIYGNVYKTPDDVLKAPYAERLETYFPGALDLFAIIREGLFPKVDSLDSLRQPAFVADFAANPDNGFRRDLTRNDLLGWMPKTPLTLCGTRDDAIVDFRNTTTAQASFREHGIEVKVIDVADRIPAGESGLNHHIRWGSLYCNAIARKTVFDPAR